jgi:CRISPR-associated endonuclease Cas1
MVNEFVYCPRLAYLMWTQGEWAETGDTVEGHRVHARVDRPGAPLPAPQALAGDEAPPTDPVNAMLSLAYAMLTRHLTIALASVGLDPYRGFYHAPRYGRPALALDLMEPFRAIVADSVVLSAVNTGEVGPNDFVVAVTGTGLTPAGRRRFIDAFERRLSQETTHPVFGYQVSMRRMLLVQARLLSRFLLGELPRYPHFLPR